MVVTALRNMDYGHTVRQCDSHGEKLHLGGGVRNDVRESVGKYLPRHEHRYSLMYESKSSHTDTSTVVKN
jgi:hypothetical protein